LRFETRDDASEDRAAGDLRSGLVAAAHAARQAAGEDAAEDVSEWSFVVRSLALRAARSSSGDIAEVQIEDDALLPPAR
jgi:hypothetical protein